MENIATNMQNYIKINFYENGHNICKIKQKAVCGKNGYKICKIQQRAVCDKIVQKLCKSGDLNAHRICKIM